VKLHYVSRIKTAATFHMQNHPVILFDGVCNFCNGAINFVIRQDKKGQFKFAPLQSATAQQLLPHEDLKKFYSFILIEGSAVFKKSDAALKVLNGLPWYWKWTQVFWVVPRYIRNAIYGVIARNRYTWFGKKEQCMIPTPEIRDRFIS
jgi:predicted DCC family thiol-disulfide oxidoreductase YuxK